MNSYFRSIFGIVFVLIMIAGFTSLSFAEYASPRIQLESGVLPGDITCKDDRILVIRINGSPACVTERTAEKTGWEIIETKSIIHISQNEFDNTLIFDDTQPNSGINLVKQVVELRVSSDVEFVDDGREYDYVLQRRPSPSPFYDKIMSFEITPEDINSDGSLTLNSVIHEKYSINQGVGFYIEDWIPTFIPDGYKLLYINNSYKEYENLSVSYDRYVTNIKYVPTNFLFHENVTNDDVIKNSKGFSIVIIRQSTPIDEIEDIIEHKRDIREKQGNNYGGFREITRDGKTVYAFEGGNGFNPYEAGIGFNSDVYSKIVVTSNYLTLDELIPIFNSVME